MNVVTTWAKSWILNLNATKTEASFFLHHEPGSKLEAQDHSGGHPHQV